VAEISDSHANGDFAGFGESFRRKLHEWNERLARFREQDLRVVVWGAGSKGVTFLNLAGQPDQIQFVVDLNPRKVGKHIAGTGQRIVPPEFLSEYRPDVVIIMNPLYEAEIRNKLAELDCRPTLISA
jgi:hypothetical protein